MKILVTGGAGYLGTVVLNRLQKDLQKGKLISLICADLREVAADKRLGGVIYEQADIRDAPRLLELCQQYQPDCIIHLAAVLDSQSLPREVQYQIDVQGTRNLIEAAIASNVKRLIVSSSGAAYGYHADNPEWLSENNSIRGNTIFAYSDHKRQVEEMLADYRQTNPALEQTIFRVGTILGASTNNLITNLFKKKQIIGLKGFKSPFVFIWDEDVADCMRHAVYSEKTGIYNLIGDGALSNQDLAMLLGKRYKAFRPAFLRLMLSILRPLGLSPYGPEQLLFLQYRPVLNNKKLKAEFGFTPQKTSLETFCYYLEEQGLEPKQKEKVQVLWPK